MKKVKDFKGSISDSLAGYIDMDVVGLVRELKRRKDYSEFKLADALRKEVNATRNLLYKLHSLNLASFIRKKDKKIGWYICYWTFHGERVGAFLLAEKKRRLMVLREKSKEEAKMDFFSCSNKCGSLEFDRAFDFSFHCPECGELLVQDGNDGKKLAEMEAEITCLEKDVELLKLEEKAWNARKYNERKEDEIKEEENKER